MTDTYRFTRDRGVYLVTTPTLAGDAWRLLDGHVSTHERGRVVCVNLHGADLVHTDAVRRAWADWWEANYVDR